MAKSSRLAFLLLLAGLAISDAFAGRVHPNLEARLAGKPADERVPIIIELEERADPRAAANGHRGDRRARGRAVVESLREVADRSQKPVIAELASERAHGNVGDVKSFWVFNGLATTAKEKAIRKIAARKDVREVRFDRAIAPPRLTPSETPTPADELVVMWNLDKIRAPETWALGTAYDGTGVVVGSFDTGVDYTHPDLASRYRGNHAISWFDPYHEHSTPYDNNGHGTHTTGTAVGGDASGAAIGVAPGARWIAAKGWSDDDNATVSAFHEIFEWFLAPGGDPANAPHVVNNSWGMSPPDCYADFLPDIQAWRAAGIFPVFAAGNEGQGAESILSPGNYAESFAVGATDIDDIPADFTGEGPSQCDGAIKPDIAAPGVAILSALPGDFWFELDGTSMATPHVTGAAAVLLSIDPALGPDELESALALGAADIDAPGPDNLTGTGRLDLLNSARLVLGIPLVGVRASIPEAREAGVVPGRFTVSRTEPFTDPLTLTYTVGGSAIPGSDYVALSGTVTIAAGAAGAEIAVTPIDDDVVELDETVIVTLDPHPDLIVSPATATVKIVSDELLPDMTVLSVTSPSTGGAGESFTASDTTTNSGPGVAPATTTRYYLSTNSTWETGDTLLASRSVAALASGASSPGSATVTIPSGLTAGTYYLVVKADAGDATVELSEDNNTNSRAIAIGPDLLPTSVTATAGAAGDSLTITDTIRNAGGGAAAASTTRYYLSVNASLEPTDALLGSRVVAPLGAGATDTGSVTVALPAGTATGSYYLIAKADGPDALPETNELNNVYARAITIGPDLGVIDLAYPSLGGAGQPITVSDTTKNLNGSAAPASTTRFYLSTNASLDAGDTLLGARGVPALAGGASSTGPVTLTIPAGTAAGYYYLIAKADGDDALAETNEYNNLLVRIITIGPDLTVSGITSPALAGAGLPIAVTDTTRNSGGGATPVTATRYYLSANITLDAADVLLGSRTVAALAPNATDTGSISLTIPAGTATGSYYLVAKADGNDMVVETSETNNTLYRAITVGPDLAVTALSVPSTGGAGLAIVVGDTTTNASGANTPATNTRFYLSSDGMLDAGDVLLGSRAVPPLAPGAASSGSVSLAIPAGTIAGNYVLVAKADGDDAVVETSETNNITSRPITVGPDLVVTALTAPSGGAGQPITVSDTVRNQGGGPAPATATRFYLSTNSSLDASDVLLGSRAVPALAAGASDTGSVVVTIPAGTATGSYYVIAKADGADALVETNEANNTFAQAMTVGADLGVVNLVSPALAGAGLAISVTDTTRNLGTGTTPPTNTRFYLSTNTALDAGDVLLGSRAIASLGSNASDTGTASLTIPAGTATGFYYLIAKADGDDALAETNESNNTIVRVITVGPDLTVNALTAPNTAGAGQAIAVSDTTRNQGGGAAPATVTRFYLSTNAALDAGDALLGSRPVAPLAPNGTDTGPVSLTIPAGTATGTYFVIAKADGDDALAETTETNNILYRAITIGPDLVLSTFSAPNIAGAGLPLTVSDTITNAGGASPASTTRFYLSVNSTLDAGDTPIGSRGVPALATGATDTGSAALTIPAGTAMGTYYLIAKADGDDALAEISEANNTLSRLVTVGPDLVVLSVTAPGGGAGMAITVSDTTRNQGGGASPATNTRYYLSNNSILDAGDAFLGSRAVAALPPGASDSGSVTLTIPAGTAAGSWYLLAKADGDDALAETSEANNVFAKSIAIGPDLGITNLVYPGAAAAGASITVSDTTRNFGAGDSMASNTRFYLSTNAALDAGDLLLGSRAVPALAPNASETGSASVTIPASVAPGYYYLIAKADGDDALGETNEFNNTLVRVLQITP